MINRKTNILLCILLLTAFYKLKGQNQLKDSGRTVLQNTKMWIEKKDTIPPIVLSNLLTDKSYPMGGEIQTLMVLQKQGFTAVFPKPFLDEVIPLDLYFSKKYRRSRKFIIQERLQIENCFYNSSSGFNDMVWGGSHDYFFQKSVGFNGFKSDCILSFEKMTFQNGLGLTNSNLYRLIFSKSNGSISLTNVTFEKDITIDSSNIQLWLRQIKQTRKDTLKFQISHSNLTSLVINPIINFERSSLPALSKFEFISDSISGSVFINENFPKLINNSNIFRFVNCFINSKFEVNNFNGCTFIFENCVFGPLSDMSNVSVTNLEFKDCINIPYKFRLRSFSSTNGFVTKLKIINSDLSNLNFDYAPNFKLDFSQKEGLHDNSYSVYETLMNRFKAEGKLISYEALKVEYMQYLYSKQGAFGYFKNYFQKYWWYYGFRKSYIIYWTLFFLTIFTIFNYFNWSSMKQAYFNGLDSKPNYYASSKWLSFKIKKIVSVFIYTSFIFFSLKVDFSKIKEERTFFLIIFFLQYFTGLICMFFIINAILKFD